jgi:hypothetical protein
MILNTFQTVMPKAYHHLKIENELEFLECIAAGGYSTPGMYPLYFILADGDVMAFETAKNNEPWVLEAIAEREDYPTGQWLVVGCEVNWEDPELYCSHEGTRIESAYAEPEEVE